MNGPYLGSQVRPSERVDRIDPVVVIDPPLVTPDQVITTPPVADAPRYTAPSTGENANGRAQANAAAETVPPQAVFGTNGGTLAALLTHEESEPLRQRWNDIQGKFVDDPRTAVQQADGLVSEAVDLITKMFADNHTTLESQWKQGNDVSTEDLRKALQHYRAFFNRLVI